MDVRANLIGNFAVTLDEGLWDTQTMSAVTTGEAARFFDTGQNNRNYADTNLETAGVMPGDRATAITGVKFYYAEQEAAVATASVDAVTLSKFGIIEIYVNNNISLRTRVADCGVGAMVTGNIGNLANSYFGIGSPSNLGYRITSPDRYVAIPPDATVYARLLLATANTTAVAASSVVLQLVGMSGFPAGRA